MLLTQLLAASFAPPQSDAIWRQTRAPGRIAMIPRYRRAKLALISDTLERAARDPARAYVALHPGTFLDTKMVHEAGIAPRGTAEECAQARAQRHRAGALGSERRLLRSHATGARRAGGLRRARAAAIARSHAGSTAEIRERLG